MYSLLLVKLWLALTLILGEGKVIGLPWSCGNHVTRYQEVQWPLPLIPLQSLDLQKAEVGKINKTKISYSFRVFARQSSHTCIETAAL